MIKIILIISLVVSVFVLISPYILDVLNYFSLGLNTILDYSSYVLDFLQDVFSAFTQYNYLMMLFYVFLSMAIISLVIKNLVR